MDWLLIQDKLESLRRCIQRVETRVPASPEGFQHDLDAQDIIALNLTRAIQLCVDIGAHYLSTRSNTPSPHTMGQTFDALASAGVLSTDIATRMRKAVGFRNIVIHNYNTVDWAIVHALCTRHLDDFKAFAAAIATLAGQRRD